MEFRILGSLQVLAGERLIPLGAAQQREVLAILLVHRGEAVSVDRIVDGLWGERPPERATKTVQVYVSRLRKALGDGVLVTRGGGYALELNGDSVDADHFRRLGDEGRNALDNGDPRGARETLTAALDLWHGPPLADFAYEAFAENEVARLAELRVVALENRGEADLALGRHAALVPELEALVREHPTRERLREQLMLALYQSGRQVEALESYRDAQRTLDEELGLEPCARLQQLERSILTHDPAIAAPPARGAVAVLRRRRRGGLLVALGGALLLAVAIAVVTLRTGSGESPTPPRVLPNSLVRVDPDTLEATTVARVGSAPDLVVAAGGFVWITHHIFREAGSDRIRDAGDRTLKRVDPETGEVETVGGGLAPCGLAPDPSGDVWVANCFASGGRDPNVVRVDATTLHFEATYRVPEGGVPAAENYYRGLAYGGGSLWVGGLEVPRLDAPKYATVIQVDPQSGEQRATPRSTRSNTALAWADTSGDLWASNFGQGTLTRLDASTRAVETVKVLGPYSAAAHILVDGETVWVGDWEHPRVERLRAVGPSRPRLVELPVRDFGTGVWQIAAGEGYIWATTPADEALWRIDPKTNKVKRIPIPYPPIGVTANQGDVWVTVRRTCIPGC